MIRSGDRDDDEKGAYQGRHATDGVVHRDQDTRRWRRVLVLGNSET